jgi:hypothetical protein
VTSLKQVIETGSRNISTLFGDIGIQKIEKMLDFGLDLCKRYHD